MEEESKTAVQQAQEIKEKRLSEVEVDDAVVSNMSDLVDLGELEMRQEAAGKIIDLFIRANLFVLAFIVILLVADWVIIWKSSQADLSARLIDKDIVMALIGATTIQLGTIMVSLSRFLFPSQKS